jgi:predicted DCC family thiol-disulfide oxidoreductase YuxK
MLELPKDKKIILFDGVCNLCESSVLFVIKYDSKDQFRFVSLQSDLGRQIIAHIGITEKNIDSVVLYQPGVAYYYKSNAALQIARSLSGFFHLGTLFRIIPTGLRNILYDYVAQNRYRWYGRKDHCLLPSPELESKFLK